ncbi:hypothetical protein HPB51_007823 [Rhipicephalus microplus]|uniref:Peptidase M13 C-terminal domain-containing protein n=1 Tax=Rhipicephalus microplus TaxID=6941 RepID=A0A9J6EZG7_RHIMP|nr:hypothetical protein HPB51_007823 [Rhipicephalus microplus]
MGELKSLPLMSGSVELEQVEPVLYRSIIHCSGVLGDGKIRQRAREEVDDFTDSENLADFVGVRLAYKAFSSLPQHQRRLTLVGLNMSAERLFFIGHCFRSCSQVNNLAPQYAPYRSRCIVPLMNMPEFSNAFGCTAGEPMNPREKCRFWA